jgi:hypothetical protein
MEPVFTTLWKDLVIAALLGAMGGFGLGLLQEKGIEMPHWYKETGVSFVDFGFISDVIIGAMAAVITYALNPPAGLLNLLAVTIAAGIGGSAILKGYIKSTAVRELTNQVEKYKAIASDASRGKNVKTKLAALKNEDKLIMRRWGLK